MTDGDHLHFKVEEAELSLCSNAKSGSQFHAYKNSTPINMQQSRKRDANSDSGRSKGEVLQRIVLETAVC